MSEKSKWNERPNSISSDASVQDWTANKNENKEDKPTPTTPTKTKGNIDLLLAIVSAAIVAYSHFGKNIFNGNIYAIIGAFIICWLILKVLANCIGFKE